MRPNVDSCAARVKGLRQPPRCPSQEWDRNAPGRYPNCKRRLLGARFLALTVAFGGSRWVLTWIGVRLATPIARDFCEETIISRPIGGEAGMADQGDRRGKRGAEDLAAETGEPQ